MKATRRTVLAGALTGPTVAGLPGVALARSKGAMLVFDPALAAGRRMAALHGGEALPIEGDRIRFARAVFAQWPSLLVGVSRHADALLIEEVGREGGYRPVDEGAAALRDAISGSQAGDRSVALGWVLAPRG